MDWWDEYNKDECKLVDTCEFYGTDKCKKTCSGYYFSKLMYQESNLPKNAYKIIKLIPEKVDVEAFKICKKYKDNIAEHVKNGEGIYIYSEYKGNGKTMWAYKFAREYIKQVSFSSQEKTKKVFYVNVSELFEFIRINMNAEDKSKLLNYETNILNADLVIFDDLGVESPTEWVMNKLYNYINARYTNGKAMIFTSNLSYMEVAKRVGHRIMDRISEVCRPVEFKGASRRRVNVWWKDQ